MEYLFEFLFNATGRTRRARYWRSLVIFGIAGLFVLVILFTAGDASARHHAGGALYPMADVGICHPHRTIA
jgi:uncharacterized membrane protein YhaH (DUF805 family)